MTEDDNRRRSAWARAQAALDDEFDAAHMAEFERELAVDPPLRKAFQTGETVRRLIRAHAPKERAPASLTARIAELAGESPKANEIKRSRSWMAALAACLAVVSFSLGFLAHQLRENARNDEPAPALVSAFARGLLSGQPFDIASSDRHTVKPWLAARTPLGAEVVDLSEAGFVLAGGRLDVIDRAPVATLVYRKREHWIDVTELPLARGGGATMGGVEKIDGYNVVRWSDAARAYVAVSDIDEGELERFVAAFRKGAQRPANETPRL